MTHYTLDYTGLAYCQICSDVFTIFDDELTMSCGHTLDEADGIRSDADEIFFDDLGYALNGD